MCLGYPTWYVVELKGMLELAHSGPSSSTLDLAVCVSILYTSIVKTNQYYSNLTTDIVQTYSVFV